VRRCLARLLPLLLALAPVAAAHAHHLPKWEFGLGAAGLNVPAYRGAKGRHNYGLPIPYLAYRGEVMKIDEEGVRGELYRGRRVHFDISLAGNVPVGRDKGGARAGMPALDPIGEIGPALNFFLGGVGDVYRHGGNEFWLRLPVRAAFSVGDPLIAHQGWMISPYFDWVWRRTTERGHWRTSLALGPLFADRKYHNYFYEVTAAQQTAQRDEYHPVGGYSGSRVTLTFSLNTHLWFVGAFARYDTLANARFVDSPLVETERYFALGIAVARIFAHSAARAPH
jgi:outer membrane protein